MRIDMSENGCKHTEGTFMRATVDFWEANIQWIGPQHQPALQTMLTCAEMLDSGNVTAAILNQYNIAARHLEKQAPATPAGDDVDQLLDEAANS